MRNANLKFGALATLCLLALIPILGNVQKQAVVRPTPGIDRDAFRRDRFRYERHALYDWLLSRGGARAITVDPYSPGIFRAALAPDLSRRDVIAQATHVQHIMSLYFSEGTAGAVTLVDLRSRHAEIAVKTGLHDTASFRDTTWHLVEHGSVIQ